MVKYPALVQELVDKFKANGYELFLYGSRSIVPLNDFWEEWLGTEPKVKLDENSDWDFAAYCGSDGTVYNFPNPIEMFLLGEGFVAKDLSESYKDSFSAMCYEKALADGTKVQIGLKYDLEGFKLVWDSLSVDAYHQFLYKRNPDYSHTRAALFMNTLYEVYRNGVSSIDSMVWE